jgi:hypothetical protein
LIILLKFFLSQYAVFSFIELTFPIGFNNTIIYDFIKNKGTLKHFLNHRNSIKTRRFYK